ncbi:hypothetical protein ABN034_08925 [Actinopolymorpha sp. B11F2]|uniref:hypothetical protein n=1 Tax=Actinopolymorpha sp. B11F2 TaxID=3160862 RepID=UPI0032E37194
MSDLLLAERTVLLHIGPYKTGTTALQGALKQARAAMAEHGVVYAGRERQHMGAALSVRGSKGLPGDPPPPISYWNRLVRHVKAASDKRVIVSSEFFCESSPELARKVVDALGGERVHILVTLRPLTKLLPSSWQQYVRNGQRASYDEWLDGMLNKPPYKRPTPSFWKRHHHEVLVERWASIVGPDNVTVVIVDDADRLGLMRRVEELVGLPTGLLEPEEGWTNRSLTWGEAELIRHLNIEFKRRGWPDTLYKNVVRTGVIQHMQMERRPGPDELRIITPAWALERAAHIGAAAGEKISALGVRVVGDISLLGAAPKAPVDDHLTAADAVLPVSAAAEAVAATVVATVPRRVLESDASAPPGDQAPAAEAEAATESGAGRPVPLEQRLVRVLGRVPLGSWLRRSRLAPWLRSRLRSLR